MMEKEGRKKERKTNFPLLNNKVDIDKSWLIIK